MEVSSNSTALSVPPSGADVILVGGGPCGLMRANELGRPCVSAVLNNDKPSTAFTPQANASQARTMEHFRRLGFADESRALGLPEGLPTDIACFTRFAKYELARIPFPSAREAKERVESRSGSWSTAELPYRVPQKDMEATLRQHPGKPPSISLNYGWRLVKFLGRRCSTMRFPDACETPRWCQSRDSRAVKAELSKRSPMNLKHEAIKSHQRG